jgi:hypothetical protein
LRRSRSVRFPSGEGHPIPFCRLHSDSATPCEDRLYSLVQCILPEDPEVSNLAVNLEKGWALSAVRVACHGLSGASLLWAAVRGVFANPTCTRHLQSERTRCTAVRYRRAVGSGCTKLRCARERRTRAIVFNYVDSLRKVSNLGKRVAESCQKRQAIDRLISSLFRSPGPRLTHPCRAPSKDD